MRATARIHNHSELKRAMLCTAQEGCYVFLYDRTEDGPCTYDYLQDDIASAKSFCAEDYGIDECDWTLIHDLIPGCQQDWISPVRVAGRPEGSPRWGEFERLENGVWKRIGTEPGAAPNGGPITQRDSSNAAQGPPSVSRSLGDFAHMDSSLKALADYVSCLSESLAHTAHANDRPLYQLYLADVAVLLALVVRGSESSQLVVRIEQHERIRAQTFLAGPEHAAIAESWQRFKRAI